MPTDLEPGIGAIILTLFPPIILDKSSAKFVILLTLTPSAGSTSNKVITGPGEILTTFPCTLNVSKECSSWLAFSVKISLEVFDYSIAHSKSESPPPNKETVLSLKMVLFFTA